MHTDFTHSTKDAQLVLFGCEGLDKGDLAGLWQQGTGPAAGRRGVRQGSVATA